MNPEALLAHGDFVRALARQLVRDPDRADELAQQSWLNALSRKAPAVKSARAWLARIVRNASRDQHRGDARRERRETGALRTGVVPSTAEIVERESLRREVVDAVLALDEPHRDVILLRFYELLPPREIASRLDLPVETVRTRIKRGLERMRATLGVEPGREGRRERILSAIAVGGITVKTSSKAVLAAIVLLLLGAAVSPFILDWVDSWSGSRSRGGAARARGTDAPARDEQPQAPEPAGPDEEHSGVPVAAASRPAAEIEVVDAGGAAADGAKILAWRDRKVFAQATCDAAGIASLAAPEGQTEVAVSQEGHPIHHAIVALGPARARVVLPRGADVSGTVEVDGGKPSEPIGLRLVWSEIGDWIEGAPNEVRHLMQGLARRQDLLASTRADGTFRFTGLPAGWSGGLYLQSFYAYGFEGLPRRAKDEDAHLMLTAPTEGLVVRLHRWPALSGRVVTAGTRAPVPKAHIYFGMFSESGDSTGTYFWTGDDGRFRVTVPVWNPVKVVLDVEDPDRITFKRFERRSSFPGDLDLGDLEISGLRSVDFVVKDPGGRPIAGAVASTGFRKDIVSGKTDADGKGSIRMEAEGGKLHVAALGRDAVDVTVPHDAALPLLVTLSPGTLVQAELRTPQGTVPPDIGVAVRFRHPWFDQTTWWPDRAIVAAGSAQTEGSVRGQDGFVARFRPDSRGTVTFGDIPAGVEFEVQARDQFQVVRRSETVTLAAAESRKVVLVVEVPPRAVRGVVRDPAGTPIRDAGVTLSVDGLSGAQERTTDAAGRFEFPSVYADWVWLQIRKDRYVLVSQRVSPPSAEQEPPVYVLTPGRQVTVSVVEASGRRLRADWMFAPPVDYTGIRNPAGDFFFENLPEGIVTFRGSVGGRFYTLDHDTKKPIATIVVPDHGSLEVAWDFRLESGSQNVLRVESPEPGGPSLKEFIQNSEEMARGAATVPLLPGRYSVWLETRQFDPLVEREWRAASKRHEVTVTAGKTATVKLEP